MKLSDYKGKEAVELLADLIEPIGKIFEDSEMVASFRAIAKERQAEAEGDEAEETPKVDKKAMIKTVLKTHSAEIIEILAYIDGENPATYSPNFFVLPKRLLELFNDEDFLSLFFSQAQSENDQSSGSATESTVEGGTE